MPDRSLRAALLLSVALLPFAAPAQDGDFDARGQAGPDPVLPDPEFSLWPHLRVAEVVGWQEGEVPSVPEGLAVTAYAADLGNPRSAHTLPNGDVLVVQSRAPQGAPVSRPKDLIRGWIMSAAQGGGLPRPGNLITLLRDANRDGAVDERHDLLAGLRADNTL